jgi:hypothetical protein
MTTINGEYLIVAVSGMERRIGAVRCNRKEVADALARWLQTQDQSIKAIVVHDPPASGSFDLRPNPTAQDKT